MGVNRPRRRPRHRRGQQQDRRRRRSAPDGAVLGAARGGGFQPPAVGRRGGGRRARRDGRPRRWPRPAGGRRPSRRRACLGLSGQRRLPVEEEQLAAALQRARLGRVRSRSRNDTFAILRAGVGRAARAWPWCAARASTASGMLPDGRTARFPAIGRISGDWGGGCGPRRGGAVVRGAGGGRPRRADGAGRARCPRTSAWTPCTR